MTYMEQRKKYMKYMKSARKPIFFLLKGRNEDTEVTWVIELC